MASSNLLTNYSKVSLVKQAYYSPVFKLPTENTNLNSTYCFLSRVLPWTDNNYPPSPTQDNRYIKSIFKNMFVAKLITSNDIAPVIDRIDWKSGTTYVQYDDSIDLFEKNPNGTLVNHFYVINRYNQVFKCLSNNNNSSSTIEPYFEPGTYGSNNIFQGSDRYKWKFMFTVDTGNTVKFMDAFWIPVPTQFKTPNPLVNSAGYGDIEVINVTNSGSGYDSGNTSITVSITGDGTGATATINPILTNNTTGGILDIIVTNPGSNYTYANVSIVSSNSKIGSGAKASTYISPIGGHGYDPVSELGCSHVMLVTSFSGTETTNDIDMIPTDIDFYQLGLVVNPVALDTTPSHANNAIYKTTYDLVVSSGLTNFSIDEIVYQGKSIGAGFYGTVLSFDSINNVLKLINTYGTPLSNAPISGNTSKATRTVLSSSKPNFTIMSGYITYIENRSGIQRSADGTEQIKIVLGY